MRLALLLGAAAVAVRAEGDDEEESNITELSADNFSDVTSDDDWKPWAVHFASGAAESKGALRIPGRRCYRALAPCSDLRRRRPQRSSRCSRSWRTSRPTC